MTDTALAAHRARLTTAETLRRNRPTGAASRQAAQRADLAEGRLVDRREQAAASLSTLARREAAHADAAADLLRLAGGTGLPSERAALRDAEAALTEVTVACDRIGDRAEALHRSRRAWHEAGARAAQATTDAEEAEASVRQRHREHQELAMRLATLEDAIGAEYRELLASLAESRREKAAADLALDRAHETVNTAISAGTEARATATALDSDRRRAEAACHGLLAPLRRTLDLPGVLDAALAISTADTESAATVADGVPEPSPLDRVRDPVGDDADGARDLATALLRTIPAPERGAISGDGVRHSLRQRRDQLGAGWDAEDHQPDDSQPLVVEVTGPLVGSRMPLQEASSTVGLHLRQQSSLLTAKQDQALRNLLQGMIAREVADKMAGAVELVGLMNRRLATVTTSHGIGATLRWKRRDDLDPDLVAMTDLLAKPPDLRTLDEDRALSAALSAMIDRTRRTDPERPYRELIGEVLDYRRWHTMSVLILRPGEPPKVLSRRTALSEGEKKVVSYLPLFAAVAASCDSLAAHAPDAPRFVLLDDAFAKVSEDNHPRLFGLLVQLDLDFVATSERLWGTHATVPELAITEVLRDAELNVIVLEHSRWRAGTLTAGSGVAT